MDSISKIKRLAASLTMVLAVTITGCGGGGNALGPPEEVTPAPEIKTPVKMRITSIKVLDFPAKSGSDDWDWDPFSATARRPDIYFVLGNHSTNVASNVPHPPGNTVVTFDGGYCQANYQHSSNYWIDMYDSDPTSADDIMLSFSLTPPAHYNNDNAKTFKTKLFIYGNGGSIELRGQWIY